MFSDPNVRLHPIKDTKYIFSIQWRISTHGTFLKNVHWLYNRHNSFPNKVSVKKQNNHKKKITGANRNIQRQEIDTNFCIHTQLNSISGLKRHNKDHIFIRKRIMYD